MSASDSRDDSVEVETNSPFYFNTSHWHAVDGMLEGVRERAGMMLLTGPTGSGKTMIMRAISEGLPEEAPALFLQYASLNFREFINFLHTSLRVGDEVLDAPNKAVALREFLYVQAKRGETGVVFIDEAHNLEPDVLKMLPKLARFDTLEDGRVVGLQFVMIASEDLREIMADPEYDEVRAKIAIDHTLRFFTRSELEQFLKKRLAPIARMTDEPITADGIEEMGRFTGGSPRLIGMICSHTMLFAAENPGRSIDAKMVQEAADALMLSPVENPFATEEDEGKAVTGLFSEADLAGEERAAAPPEFSDTQTVYSTDAPDLRETESDHVTPPLSAEDTTPEPDASLYSDDHEAMKKADPDDAQDAGPDAASDAEEDADFDVAAFESALDDVDDDADYDDDEDFDDDADEFDEADMPLSKKDARPGVRKGGLSFLHRLGWRSRGGDDRPAKVVVGASRKKQPDPDAASAPATAPRRGTKARVVGAREKQLKMAGAGVAAVMVLGLGYVAIPPAISAIGGVFDGALSGPGRVASAEGAMPSVDAPDGDTNTVTVAIDNRRSPTTGGWGARVVVADDSVPDTPPNDGVKGVLPVPDVASGAVKGALDIVDRALGSGERGVDNDTVGGLLAAASDKVTGLRDRVSRNGMTPEQLAEEVRKKVAEGDAHFEARRYITPKRENAYDAYREALALDSDNEAALAGVGRLREHYAEKADGARAAQQWESANGFFETAIAISNLRAVK